MDQKQLEPFCVRTQGLSDESVAELLEIALRAGARPGKRVDLKALKESRAFEVSTQWEYVGVNEQYETDFFVSRDPLGEALFAEASTEAKPPRVVTASWIRSHLGLLASREVGA